MVAVRSTVEGIKIALEVQEAALLRELLAEMTTLLEADLPRADAVTARLFPDAYEDDEEAAKFHTLVGNELRASKIHAVDTVRGKVGRRGSVEATIPPSELTEWLTLLTDLRLAIGTRLEITEEKMSREPDEDDPEAPALSVLHWLGWVQESLLEATR